MSGAIGSLPVGASAIGGAGASISSSPPDPSTSYIATGAIGTLPIGAASIGGTGSGTSGGASSSESIDWLITARRRGRR